MKSNEIEVMNFDVLPNCKANIAIISFENKKDFSDSKKNKIEINSSIYNFKHTSNESQFFQTFKITF